VTGNDRQRAYLRPIETGYPQIAKNLIGVRFAARQKDFRSRANEKRGGMPLVERLTPKARVDAACRLLAKCQ
jgi:hypothetical protein